MSLVQIASAQVTMARGLPHVCAPWPPGDADEIAALLIAALAVDLSLIPSVCCFS
ncbi:hypothetical protein ABT297_33805 [Dactylosporangium sp. NPDC000555]|uniref:hypothetical protein n=1 Tax=Dactylosporangium sp. NPDC000555 TaxID=3154260 RepID=UPI00332DC1D9